MSYKVIKNTLFATSLVSLALFLITFIKPLLIIAFVSFAVASRFSEKLKGITYSLWILTSVSVSMSYPELFIGVGDFKFKSLIIPLLQIIMFGMGSQMSLKDLYGVIKMPYGVIMGVILQFTIMPIVGFSVAKAFQFPPEIAAGIILVGCSPCGLASNVMSFLARANLALSITITTVATLLSPFMTPFLMQLFASELIELNFLAMMADIFNIVILPICAGLTFNLFSNGSHTVPQRIKQMVAYMLIILLKNYLGVISSEDGGNLLSTVVLFDYVFFAALPIALAYTFKLAAKGDKRLLDRMLSFISMAGIAIIITVITAAGRDSLLTIGALLMLACFIHNSCGYLLGYSCSRFVLRLPERDCRTIALEVGMQNGGLASGLALQMGKIATVGLAPAIFGPMMNITGSVLASWWRGRPPKGTVEFDDTKKPQPH